jgi:lysophospholipid acyltransferase (LPLAT)-like uncharacterized protein
LGVVLGVVARLWLATLRVRVTHDAALLGAGGRPWVLGFWHGTQWGLLAWKRRRRTVVMVSWSADGATQAKALGLQGLAVVRGSSSNGGARGLAALVRAVKAGGTDAAFAVDGPKGPRCVAKEGAAVAARAAGAWLVPIGCASTSALVLRKAWDRFTIALPFTRVAVHLGAPVDPEGPDATARLTGAIDLANMAAERALGSPRARVSGELRQAGDGLDLDAGAAR